MISFGGFLAECLPCFVVIYAVLSRNLFLLRFTHFCLETNLTKDCVCGEKMTNMRYVTTSWGGPRYLKVVLKSFCLTSIINLTFEDRATQLCTKVQYCDDH